MHCAFLWQYVWYSVFHGVWSMCVKNVFSASSSQPSHTINPSHFLQKIFFWLTDSMTPIFLFRAPSSMSFGSLSLLLIKVHERCAKCSPLSPSLLFHLDNWICLWQTVSIVSTFLFSLSVKTSTNIPFVCVGVFHLNTPIAIAAWNKKKLSTTQIFSASIGVKRCVQNSASSIVLLFYARNVFAVCGQSYWKKKVL